MKAAKSVQLNTLVAFLSLLREITAPPSAKHLQSCGLFQNTPGKANVIADTLSRSTCGESNKEDGVCSVIIDLPARSPADLRRAQLDDLELKKIVSDLEDISDADSVGVKRLLQTPVLNQRGEVLAIDLFGPLPQGENGEKWILLAGWLEDTATRWIELFALREATSEACARMLIEEYFLRYGLPRRIVSDNGVQFVSVVMQQCMFVLNISQKLLPIYHPSANPAERKNRDLKFQLSRLVDVDHDSWPQHLPSIRFAMNSAVCQTTGVSPAYLSFARELRSPLDVQYDIRSILNKDSFVPQITPYLKKFVESFVAVKERVECEQNRRKGCAVINQRGLLKSSRLETSSDSDSEIESVSGSCSNSIENNKDYKLPDEATASFAQHNNEVKTAKTLSEKLRCWTLDNLNIL
ncbi:unnamed protein product [Euphydryas editha]|uniref:Integrase catalytic domain-containing protein n=1 Tax=Euphydryas editha TaxID=104508 RepID=A0AAU9TWQ6_EUPED|nr:unnamed protein product [Euphydryas editha]